MSKCAWDRDGQHCTDPSHGKSKYCLTHKRIVRHEFATRVKNKVANTTERSGPLLSAKENPKQLAEAATLSNLAAEGDYAAIYKLAQQEALIAYKAAAPTPMMVQQHQSVLDDKSPVTEQWYVGEGICGMAWVRFPKANTSFTRWLRLNGKSSKHYLGGCTVHIDGYRGQSYERACAAAHKFCEVISGYLPDEYCYTEDRLD